MTIVTDDTGGNAFDVISCPSNIRKASQLLQKNFQNFNNIFLSSFLRVSSFNEGIIFRLTKKRCLFAETLFF